MKRTFIFSMLFALSSLLGAYGQEEYSAANDGKWTLVLDEKSEDNETVLAEYAQKTCNVSMKRTIKAGMYNTLCLPFDVDEAMLIEKFGNDVELATLNGAHMVDGNVVFEFENTNEYGIIAGLPYLIHVSKDVVNPTFSDVTIKNKLIPIVFELASFIPIYNITSLENGNMSVRFLGKNNTLYYPDINSGKLGGFRAFFKISDENAYGAKSVFVVEDKTTGVKRVFDGKQLNDEVYDLQGRRVFQPTKGLYIVNGKKIIIK